MENKDGMIRRPERNSAIELCRILSMLMIVICHFATHGGFDFDRARITAPRLWWYVIEMGGNFGVDVFILISGYFLISHTELKINFKRIAKLWGQVFFYSVAIFALSIALGLDRFSAVRFVKSLFPVTTEAWWFVTAYFVMFLLHPFLNKLLHALDQRQYQRLLLLLLFIWCVVPTFTTFPLASNELCQFLLIYTVGGYIRLYGDKMKLKSRHFFLLWLAAALVTWLSAVVLMVLGKKAAVFADHAAYFYGRLSLPTLLGAVFFFMIFVKMKIPASKFINTVSSAAFGVYLIHDSAVIRPLLWEKVFANAGYQESLLLIPYSIAAALIVYAVCTLIDLARIHTVEALYMKAVGSCADRIAAPFGRIAGRISGWLFGKE